MQLRLGHSSRTFKNGLRPPAHATCNAQSAHHHKLHRAALDIHDSLVALRPLGHLHARRRRPPGFVGLVVDVRVTPPSVVMDGDHAHRRGAARGRGGCARGRGRGVALLGLVELLGCCCCCCCRCSGGALSSDSGAGGVLAARDGVRIWGG